MLVVTRRVRESVKIGDHVVVTILEARSGSVRIGVEAPDDVPILRADGPPSSVLERKFCRLCKRWVEASVWSSMGVCDFCATEAPSIHDRYDGIDDIHEGGDA